MSKYFRPTLKNFLGPCLTNIVGIKQIQDYENEPKCKSLLYHDCDNFQLNEISDQGLTSNTEKYLTENRSYFSEHLEKYDHDFYRDLLYQRVPQTTAINSELQAKVCAVLHDEFLEKFLELLEKSGVDTNDRNIDWSLYTNAVTIAVSVNGKLLLKIAFNNQDRENRVSTKEDMVGCIGSITKTFTALMIMKLIKEEALSESENIPAHKRQRASESDEEFASESDEFSRITLDSYVEDILTPDVWPEHFLSGETDGRKHKITIKQLLHHTSGIRSNYHPLPDELLNTGHGSLQESIKVIKDEDLFGEPGECKLYSNFGYQLLALVYEKRTGRSFVEDLRDELAKMGLYDTDFSYREYLALDRARGYKFRYLNGNISKNIYEDLSWFEASYGLVSTTSDLIKYGNIVANCLLNVENAATYPLDHASMTLMMTDYCDFKKDVRHPYFRLDGELTAAYCWHYRAHLEYSEDEEAYEEQIIFHHGGTPETLSCLTLFRNNIDAAVPNATLQNEPLIYPLGEDLNFKQNIVVGTILTDRSLEYGAHDLLFKIINLVYSSYIDL